MWKSIVAISVGASLGAVLRWWFGLALNSFFPTIPPGTLTANLVGGYRFWTFFSLCSVVTHV